MTDQPDRGDAAAEATADGDPTAGAVRTALSRRRVLVAAVPGLLAGCLVESGESGESGGSADSSGSTDTAEGGDAAEGDADEDSDADGEHDAGATEDDESQPTQTEGSEDPSDQLGPDGSGLVVANAAVRSVTDRGAETTVRAEFTVENAGRFTYGTIEFRADAYATRPGSRSRDAVGYAYVVERFESGNRFDDGTRRVALDISFRSRDSRARADPDWYDVDVAIRRAEPV
ncbi:hypothetical protein C461_09537 [Halorubrum aidingense JCM 13560]|uniref:Uncharacterized protein n=1 Tax=Halorubrum aidingense JCM 13560 TaxID=1230454 RepID=M0PDV3_9EURY|nr:hypothetical protein [Halorubrum aidingense]EMA66990.1 hypothetical protein C461_09537 [Halorubrum aidingense JCM 13560]